jgi:hypothetical protein
MTRANLITAINDQLTAIITQAKVRLASLQIVNELFPTETSQSILVNGIQFEIKYKKTGNECRVWGTAVNTTNQLVQGAIITIPNSLFFGKGGMPILNTSNRISEDCIIRVSTNQIRLIGLINANETLYINTNYQTND